MRLIQWVQSPTLRLQESHHIRRDRRLQLPLLGVQPSFRASKTDTISALPQQGHSLMAQLFHFPKDGLSAGR